MTPEEPDTDESGSTQPSSEVPRAVEPLFDLAGVGGELVGDELAGDVAADGDELVEVIPEFVQALMAAGLISDELKVGEVTATDGPTYDLDELSVTVVGSLCDQLDAASVQWVIDRAGRLLVHRNDERRADSVVEDVFGPTDTVEREAEFDEVRSEVEAMAERLGAQSITSSGRSSLLLAVVVVVVVVVAVTVALLA